VGPLRAGITTSLTPPPSMPLPAPMPGGQGEEVGCIGDRIDADRFLHHDRHGEGEKGRT
jgi:hypothetical protein